MLSNWLRPLSKNLIDRSSSLSIGQFGARLVRFEKKMPDLKGVKIALIGLDEPTADAVRAELYQLAWPFGSLAVADLGNLRKSDPSFAIPLFFELLAGKILPIYIGPGADSVAAQFLAYQNTKSIVHLALVDERFRSDFSEKTPFAALFEPRHPMLFHLSLLAGQSHFLQPDFFDFFEKNRFDLLNLGRLKNALEEAEPAVRDADLVAFSIAALKKSDAPAQIGASPSGLTSEEACQIARYAGLSDKLTSFGIFGFEKSEKNGSIDSTTAQTVAQMIWYFVSGVQSRKNDYPASTDALIEYIVDFPQHEWQLTFWKSSKSGRWWVQIPVETSEQQQRHRLVPCTLADYQMACREELPDRLFQAFRRFGVA